MTREEFIELSKTALAPALKGRRRPDGTEKIFYSKSGLHHPGGRVRLPAGGHLRSQASRTPCGNFL